jgi:hypothetical protein
MPDQSRVNVLHLLLRVFCPPGPGGAGFVLRTATDESIVQERTRRLKIWEREASDWAFVGPLFQATS